MSLFTGNLTLTHLNADWRLWQIETPLRYEVGHEGSGRVIEVPAGFVTDGASVPRLLWPLFPSWGRYSRAAVIHDYLGHLLVNERQPHAEGRTQAQIDAIFYEAMEVCGVALPIRVLIWIVMRAVALVRRLD